MSISIQEASTRFLDDLNEKVSYDRFVTIANALGAFVAYLAGTGTRAVTDLRMEHVRTYLLDESGQSDAALPEKGATWHAVKAFIKWIGQRKLARGFVIEFARSQGVLRQEFMGS